MSILRRLWLAFSCLLFSYTSLACEETGYLALTNAGYVSVTSTIDVRAQTDFESENIYRDRLIDDNSAGIEDYPDTAFTAADAE